MDIKTEIFSALKGATSIRRTRKENLAARICLVLDDYRDAGGWLSLLDLDLSRQSVDAPCHQGVGWPSVRGTDTDYYVGNAALRQIDCGFFDGSNYQRQCGRARFSDGAISGQATVAQLVALAKALPDAMDRAVVAQVASATADAETMAAAQAAI